MITFQVSTLVHLAFLLLGAAFGYHYGKEKNGKAMLFFVAFWTTTLVAMSALYGMDVL